MKKILFLIFMPFFAASQIIFNGGSASPSSASISIEFGSGNLGLVLPYVSSAGAVSGAVNGTLIYDTADGVQRVKVLENNLWRDLSVVSGGLNSAVFADQNNRAESTGAKVVVKATEVPDSATPGILVLEDSDRAMVLPKVASPHLNIVNPAPGLIAYDTVRKQLAVFNGTVWTFWE